MIRRGDITNLPPYDLRGLDDHSPDAAKPALDAEADRVQHFPQYLSAIEQWQQEHPNATSRDIEQEKLWIPHRLETQADEALKRLDTAKHFDDFNQPTITDEERALLISFSGIHTTYGRSRAEDDIELGEEYAWRRWCVRVLRMAYVGRLAIADAAPIREGVDDGSIPDVLKPWILVDLRERFEQGDVSLERLD